MEMEDKILNSAAAVAIIGLFLPWIGGEWLGDEDEVAHIGFSFFTSFLGIGIFLLLAFTLAVALVPLFGGPVVVKKRYRDLTRLICTSQALVLTLAALSVLTRVTFQFARLEVRFGIYITLIGSLVAAIYAYLRFQEFRRQSSQAIFHHPEAAELPHEKSETFVAPPPPPAPPAPAAEDHRILP